MGYVIGVDIGGTFTDCTLLTPDGRVVIGKASSTPPDFETGFVDSIEVAARRAGVELRDVIASADGIYHGCTVGTNALVQGRVAKVGLITTAGHRDSIFMMRAGRRLVNQSAEYIANVARHHKPEPLVPRDLVMEVDERVAFDGNALVSLNENSVREAIDALVESGVEAIAVALLWSVSNPAHELRVRELLTEHAPELFVSLSSEVMPRVGEYERAVTTVINAGVGPVMRAYLNALQTRLAEAGFLDPIHIMTCAGGLIDPTEAVERPVLTIGSGPVAGLIGAQSLASAMVASSHSESASVLTADVGGTTFDVGVIRDGAPLRRPTSWHGQYEYYVPTLDVRSVGSGGGSLVAYDAERHTLQVGPDSAGARPGPVCYGLGGTQATVSDANLIMGYLNPSFFLEGEIELDVAGARDALARAGKPLGLDADEAAIATIRIVDNQMADAVRLVSIQQGHDPRNLTMYAYGGGGPLHGVAVARELGIAKVVVPLSDLASGWSAFGVATADAVVVEESGIAMEEPFDAARIAEVVEALERTAVQKVEAQGVERSSIEIERFADVKYKLQVHELETLMDSGRITPETTVNLLTRFESDYERLYGEGSGYSDAGFAIAGFRVRASASVSGFSLPAPKDSSEKHEVDAVETRPVLFPDMGNVRIEAGIYRGAELVEGSIVRGPAIIEYPNTTAVLHEGDVARVDSLGNLIVDVNVEGASASKDVGSKK